jgi:hypothetical protein
MAVAFDTLTYARKLRDTAVPQEQTEAHAAALGAKHDLRELECRLAIRLGGMLAVATTSLARLL